jgi:hypothetical protein
VGEERLYATVSTCCVGTVISGCQNDAGREAITVRTASTKYIFQRQLLKDTQTGGGAGSRMIRHVIVVIGHVPFANPLLADAHEVPHKTSVRAPKWRPKFERMDGSG